MTPAGKLGIGEVLDMRSKPEGCVGVQPSRRGGDGCNRLVGPLCVGDLILLIGGILGGKEVGVRGTKTGVHVGLLVAGVTPEEEPVVEEVA